MTLEIVAARIQQLERQMERVLELVEEKETKPKGEKPKRRGTTGYILYSKTNRAEAKAEMEGAKPTEVVTELAKRWKALTEEEREEWNAKADWQSYIDANQVHARAFLEQTRAMAAAAEEEEQTRAGARICLREYWAEDDEQM